MISTIQVLHPGTASLEEKLPKGHVIDVANSLVLLVGENGTGKSGFLRLLKTSLEYAQWFHGTHPFEAIDISRITFDGDKYNVQKRKKEFHPFFPNVSKLLFDYRIPEPNNHLYPQNKQFVAYFLPNVISDPEGIKNVLHFYKTVYPDLPFDPDVDVMEVDYTYDSLGKQVHAKAHVLSRERLAEICGMIGTAAKEDRPVNRWGFLLPQPENNIYHQCYASYIPVVQTRGDRTGNAAYIDNHFTFQLNDFTRKKSTGQMTKNVVQKIFKNIERFFTDYVNPTGKLTPSEAEELLEIVPGEKRNSSRLLVLMDEPTSTLSYRNKYQFRDTLLELAQRYAPRLQFFVATNEPVLIEHTDCLFLDFDTTPVEARRKL